MFIGKTVLAAVGWWVDPWMGTLVGAMAGHVIDLTIARRLDRGRETHARRRARRRAIGQAGVRSRGHGVRGGETLEQGSVPMSSTLIDSYRILGAAHDADRDTVKARWRALLSEWHPDKRAARGDAVDAASNDRLNEVQRAWERVRDTHGWR